jgi:hypothetical protein
MTSLAKKALLAASVVSISVEARALESGLYNTYSTNAARTRISSLTCGATRTTSGCYGFADLGTFRRACAMVTTTIDQKQENGATTYRRQVIVMDKGAVNGAKVTLSIFRETQTIDATDDVTLNTAKRKTLTLPLVGGPSASCYLARNGAGFYVGTNKNPNAVLVSNDLSMTTLPGFSPPIPVASINAMQGGYVTVTHKGGTLDGFYMFRNDGSLEEDGGGAQFVVGTQNGALIPGEKPSSASVSTAASSGTLLDAQAHPVASNGSSITRNAAGTITLNGAQPAHFPAK